MLEGGSPSRSIIINVSSCQGHEHDCCINLTGWSGPGPELTFRRIMLMSA
jgi:hypothetical protein